MNRRIFFKRSLIATPLAIGATAGYGRYIERHNVEVVRIPLEIGLGQPRTVALLSDIHFDPLCEVDYLQSVINRVNSLSPDFIFYAGDFMTDSARRVHELADILRNARSAIGSFAILGNHDQKIAADVIGTALASAGMTVLRNESVALPELDNWYLTGLESFWAGRPSTASIGKTPASARHIVLAHEPDSFDRLTDSRIALQLSGHTHGGQIRLPFVGALHVPSWGKKYEAGLYERDGRRLYVNRGIGTVAHHYRVNCAPEITFLELT